MIDVAYVQRMARYNRWQNDNLIGVANRLSDEERRQQRGAFFGSIHGTFNHLLWADTMWLSRLVGTAKPTASLAESAALCPDWDTFKHERDACDARMEQWARELNDDHLKSDLSWFSGAIKADVTKPMWIVVAHIFNHQTHHRGQIHAMLTQAGGKPGDTDLFIMPEQPIHV